MDGWSVMQTDQVMPDAIGNKQQTWLQTQPGTSKTTSERMEDMECVNAKSHAVNLRVQSGPRSLQHEMR